MIKHSKIKLTILIISICIVASSCTILFGSSSGRKDIKDFSHAEDAFYKQDINSSTGQLAMVYYDKIYYISNEDGKNTGLYRMDTDGSDVEYLVMCKKSTKIIGHDDRIFVLNRRMYSENKYVKPYSLFLYNIKNEDYDKDFEIPYLVYCESDITICKNGDVFTTAINYETEGMPIVNMHLEYISPDGTSDMPKPIIEKELVDLSLVPEDICKLAVYDGFILSTIVNTRPGAGKYEEGIGNFECAVYNTETGETLMHELWKDDIFEFKVIYADDKYIYMAFKNDLIIYDADTLEVYKEINASHDYEYSSPDYEELDYAIESQGKLFLIFTKESAHERVVSLDLETYETNEIFKSSYEVDNKKLINIQDNCILYADDNKIYYQEIEGTELGKMRFEMSFDENIIDNNLFEVAGDWLFIHSKGEPMDNDAYELLYKINLITKETMSNGK